MNSNTQQMPCLVCGAQLQVRVATGRKSGKPFIMVICAVDGRHFRGFVGDKEFVRRVARAAGIQEVDSGPTTKGVGVGVGLAPPCEGI
jgi:hypothetical protein